MPLCYGIWVAVGGQNNGDFKIDAIFHSRIKNLLNAKDWIRFK